MVSRLLSSLSQHQIGFLLMLVTVMCFPAMDTVAKILTQTQPVLQVVWARYAGQFLLLLIVFIALALMTVGALISVSWAVVEILVAVL